MSHSVTITRTTTTTSTSAIILNTGYLKTMPGFLKLAQLLLGIVCVGLVGYYINNYYIHMSQKAELFFFVIAVTFMIGTFCILFSCLISLSTGTVLSKTIYEMVYHFIACALYFAASITLLVEVNNHQRYQYNYEPYLAASIIGLIVAALYLFSGILAAKQYRGL